MDVLKPSPEKRSFTKPDIKVAVGPCYHGILAMLCQPKNNSCAQGDHATEELGWESALYYSMLP